MPRSNLECLSMYRAALLALATLRQGEVVTQLLVSARGVHERMSWARSAAAVREHVGGRDRDARLLLALDAALSLGLVRMTLVPRDDQRPGFFVHWHRS